MQVLDNVGMTCAESVENSSLCKPTRLTNGITAKCHCTGFWQRGRSGSVRRDILDRSVDFASPLQVLSVLHLVNYCAQLALTQTWLSGILWHLR